MIAQFLQASSAARQAQAANEAYRAQINSLDN